MGREAFRVKIAEIASRRGGGWSPVAACTWQSHRATSCAPDTLCLCIRRIFGWRVDSLQLLPFVRPTGGSLFFLFFLPLLAQAETGPWTFFCFFFVFRVSFRNDTRGRRLDTWLTWLVYGFNHSQGESFFRFFPLSLFESERKLALERNWFRMFVSWGLNV